MKCVRIEKDFGLENLHVADVPDPGPPGPEEVTVEMAATSLNYRDLMTVEGHYNPRQPLPLIPCSDGVGRVREVGTGVTRFEVGDRVLPTFSQEWIAGRPDPARLRSTLGGPLDGTLTEVMRLKERGLVRAPASLGDEEAACLPCAALTAWSALITEGKLRPGDRVLVQGSGGVSVFALQFAVALGASVVATSSSGEKMQRLRSLGAAETINYRDNPEWGDLVREWSGGEGVDHVVEVGGAETLRESLKAIRMGGTISLIGVLSGTASQLGITPILMKKVRIQGILVGYRDSFEAMNRAVETKKIKPVVDRVFPFEEAVEAFRYLKSQKHIGKIVIGR